MIVSFDNLEEMIVISEQMNVIAREFKVNADKHYRAIWWERMWLRVL